MADKPRVESPQDTIRELGSSRAGGQKRAFIALGGASGEGRREEATIAAGILKGGKRDLSRSKAFH